jgi:hypothetical protein
MNTILQLVLSTFLLLQLGTAAFVPFSKLMNRNRRTVTKQILNNYIDEYEPQTTAEGRISHSFLCNVAHFNACNFKETWNSVF